MGSGTVLRWGELWASLSDLIQSRPRPLFGYAVAGVLIPWLFFFIFPQSNMRGFAAFLLNNGWYSAETPWTIVSMFLIAIVGIGGFVFAAWSALLSETRDAVSGEILTGFVNALLAFFVTFAVLAVFAFTTGFIGVQLRLAMPGVPNWLISTPFTLLLIAILARLCLAGPAMAAEGSINPIHGLRRSWELTRGHFGKLMLVVGPLYVLALAVIALFIGVGLALLMASDGTGWHDRALSAVWLMIELALVLVVILVPAALYRTIRPAVAPDVFT